MFSAVYLVCFVGQPCEFYVDAFPYDSEVECQEGAISNVSRNMVELMTLGRDLPEVEFQCFTWSKA